MSHGTHGVMVVVVDENLPSSCTPPPCWPLLGGKLHCKGGVRLPYPEQHTATPGVNTWTLTYPADISVFFLHHGPVFRFSSVTDLLSPPVAYLYLLYKMH